MRDFLCLLMMFVAIRRKSLMFTVFSAFMSRSVFVSVFMFGLLFLCMRCV